MKSLSKLTLKDVILSLGNDQRCAGECGVIYVACSLLVQQSVQSVQLFSVNQYVRVVKQFLGSWLLVQSLFVVMCSGGKSRSSLYIFVSAFNVKVFDCRCSKCHQSVV